MQASEKPSWLLPVALVGGWLAFLGITRHNNLFFTNTQVFLDQPEPWMLSDSPAIVVADPFRDMRSQPGQPAEGVRYVSNGSLVLRS